MNEAHFPQLVGESTRTRDLRDRRITRRAVHNTQAHRHYATVVATTLWLRHSPLRRLGQQGSTSGKLRRGRIAAALWRYTVALQTPKRTAARHCYHRRRRWPNPTIPGGEQAFRYRFQNRARRMLVVAYFFVASHRRTHTVSADKGTPAMPQNPSHTQLREEKKKAHTEAHVHARPQWIFSQESSRSGAERFYQRRFFRVTIR